MNKKTYHIFFSRLSNPVRIEIISALREKEMSVNELCKKLKIEQSKLSHALGSLRCCNIVQSKVEGKKRIYYLNRDTILPILKIIDKHEKTFCKNCPAKSQ